jgi:hypothetical protein
LFSAAVATLVSISIQDLRPNSQDNSEFYLANIYQLLASANGSHVSIPSTLVNPFIKFSPPKYAIWVNSLWFLSLTISLGCALLATLLKQWVRRYVKITQPRYGPHKRARIRSFFAEGIDKLHLPWAVEALPTLLHISVFLFFGGLLIYLFNIDLTVFTAVVWWIGFCTAAYACITFMPIFRHDSPYYAPLSSTIWFLVNGAILVVFKVLFWFASFRFFSQNTWNRFDRTMGRYRISFLYGIRKAAEESSLKLSSEIDSRAIMWTFESLDEDHEFERFFSGIPGFFLSKVVPDVRGTFFEPNGEKLSETMVGFLDRTLSSKLVSQPVKQRRTTIFSKAMEVASLPINWAILDRVLHGEWDGLLNSVEFGHTLKRVQYSHPFTVYLAQSAVSIIIARVQERDNRWFELATRQLGLNGSALQHYLFHGDSVLLANCIYICRQTIHVYSENGWSYRPAASQWKTLEEVSEFDVQHILPELQHEFCDLWNEIVQLAHNRNYRYMRSVSIDILRHCRRIYLALHQGGNVRPRRFTASTADDDRILLRKSSYTACNTPGHHSHSAHPYEVATGVTGEISEHGSPLVIPSLHYSMSFLHPPHLERTNSATDTSMHSIDDTIPRSSEVSSSPYQLPSPVTPLFPRDTSILMGNEEPPYTVPPSFPIPVIVVSSSPLPTEVSQMDHIHSAQGPRSLPPTPLTAPSYNASEAMSPLDDGPTLDPKMLDPHLNTRAGYLLAMTEPTHHQPQPIPSYSGPGKSSSPHPQDEDLSGLPDASLQSPANMRF